MGIALIQVTIWSLDYYRDLLIMDTAFLLLGFPTDIPADRFQVDLVSLLLKSSNRSSSCSELKPQGTYLSCLLPPPSLKFSLHLLFLVLLWLHVVSSYP